MPSITESVNSLLGRGGNFEKLGKAVGVDKDKAELAVGAVTPQIVGGLADKATAKGGVGTVNTMVDEADGSVLDDLGKFFADKKSEGGSSTLDSIFGSDRSGLIDNLVGKTGLSGGIIGKVLPLMAPIVMGVLGKRKVDEGLDSDGVVSLLATEKASLASDGLLSSGAAKGAAAAAAGVALGKNLKGKAGDGVAEGAKLADGGVEQVKGAAKGGKKATAAGAKAVKSSAGATKSKAKATAAATVDNGSGTSSSLSWIGYALGLLALVAVLALLASQCISDSDKTTSAGSGSSTSAVEKTTTTEDADNKAAPASSAAENGVSDDELQKTVDATLPEGVSASIKDGVVTLTGEVATSEEADKAVADVENIKEVTSVENKLTYPGSDDADASDDDKDKKDGAGDGSLSDELDLGAITFEYNSAQLTAEGQAVADKWAAYLDGDGAETSVLIVGHTDSLGQADDNLDLSKRRAAAVKTYLESKGIAADRMETDGKGAEEPKFENDTEANRAKNRRIEFIEQ